MTNKKQLEEAVRDMIQSNSRQIEKLKGIVQRLSAEPLKGRLTLSAGDGGEERTISGKYDTLREAVEIIEQPLREIWGISIHFSDSEILINGGAAWQAKLQTEARYREAMHLPQNGMEG